ncbi:MAG TPA: hypothetical protein VHA33_30770 [Candidatus Angelobacter sp.]|nr:hypothetical protein [Candidatus Angelobacter sp.]
MQFLDVRSGLLSIITVILLLVIVAVVIAPQVDLEDGVLGVEQILYALLMALASIVALRVIRTPSPSFVPRSFCALNTLADLFPSCSVCRLLC